MGRAGSPRTREPRICSCEHSTKRCSSDFSSRFRDRKLWPKIGCPQEFFSAGAPPFLIVHGTADPTVPYQQSVVFRQALADAKVPVSLLTVTNGGHGKGFSPAVTEIVHRFLAFRLLGEGTESSDATIPALAR